MGGARPFSRGRASGRLFCAVGVGVVAIVLGLNAFGALDSLELSSVDARFSLRGAKSPPNGIVLVGIDGESIARIGSFPFPRGRHADAIRSIAEGGARTIAYDVQFTEASVPREDRALADAVKSATGVVLATEEVDENGESPVFGGEDVVAALGAKSGMTSVFPPDPGGIYRRMEYEGQGLKSFDLVAAEQATGERVPHPAGDNSWIDYQGPPMTFAIVPFWRVVSGQVDPNVFKDKIVVVGATSPSLGDVRGTSFSGGRELMSGAEIHANAIVTALAGFPLGAPPGWLNVGLIVVMGLVAPLGSLALSPRRALALALLAGLAFIVATQIAFNAGLITAFVYPLLAFLLAGFGALIVHHVGVSIERLRTRDLFGRFVPDSVVNEVLTEAGAGLRLGGVRREATILFSDLRGFSSVAEKLEPEQVIEVVNRYLGEMSSAILDNGGTLIAYAGDGIFAAFGVPLDQPDHADRAVATARELVGPRLDAFNEWVVESGLGEGFRMGVGLNTGQVMAGNVGSERRVEYTAIGDTTNTASRIEGMTKGSGRQLFIAGSTRAAMRDRSAAEQLVYVDEFEVRGREQGVQIWSLAEDGPQVS